MGNGIVEKLKKDFTLEVQWIGYELHPETPPEGVALSKLFPGFNPGSMVERLSKAGAPYGVSFNKVEVLSNSRLALEATEFARDRGKFKEAHERFFEFYFLEGRDIGDLQTVLEISEDIGLDVKALEDSLRGGVYLDRFQKARALGAEHGVAGIPAFIFNGGKKIVGAQQYENFVRVLSELV